MNVSWDSCSEKKGKAQNVPNSKPPSSNNQHSSGKMAHGLQVEPRGLPKPGDVGGDTKTRGDKKSGKSQENLGKSLVFGDFHGGNDDKHCSIGH